MAAWTTHHSDWEHLLWTDADNRQLIHRHFPHLLRIFDIFSGVQQADMVRYALMYCYGGIWADLDSRPVRPVVFQTTNTTTCSRRTSGGACRPNCTSTSHDEIPFAARVVLSPEPCVHTHALYKDNEKQEAAASRVVVSNAVVMSAPGQPFWLHVLAIMQSTLRLQSLHDVLRTTGPLMLTQAVATWTPSTPHPKASSSLSSSTSAVHIFATDSLWMSKPDSANPRVIQFCQKHKNALQLGICDNGDMTAEEACAARYCAGARGICGGGGVGVRAPMTKLVRSNCGDGSGKEQVVGGEVVAPQCDERRWSGGGTARATPMVLHDWAHTWIE